jgi:hypothetical protein
MDEVRVAWQILLHRAAEVGTLVKTLPLGTTAGKELKLFNSSYALDGRFDIFSLTGTSPRIQKPYLPQPGDNFAVVDLAAVGARLVDIGGGQYGIQFAINTFGQRAHPNYPAVFEIEVDANRDGTPDWVVFNAELGGFAASGQNVVAVRAYNATSGPAYFFTDADLNSANAILTAPLSALGLTEATQFTFNVRAYDNYFTGIETDAIVGMTYTAGVPRFFATGPNVVPVGGTATLFVQPVAGGSAASPSQIGLLLLYRDARPGMEASVIKVTAKP